MLVNFNNKLFSVLQALHNSDAGFYLTGSRFFGGWTEDSDYDFLVSLNGVNLGLLYAPGFQESLTYPDEKFMLSWRDRIHIIVVQNLTTRLMVQEKLKRSGLMMMLKKPERKKLWDLVLKEFKS